MFNVSICDLDPEQSIKFAASMCYQPTIDKALDKMHNIDTYEGLFKPGHVTTAEHAPCSFAFVLDQIPISLATFGLHMMHPFYNTSQRSGRYCRSMFDGSDSRLFDVYLDDLVKVYFDGNTDLIDWVKRGIEIFDKYLPITTEHAKIAIKRERPHFNGNIDIHADRIAQEQLRVVLSTILPTGMVYTVDIITLISMFYSAWNAPLRSLTRDMLIAVSRKHDISFVSKVLADDITDSAPIIPYEIEMVNKLGLMRMLPKSILLSTPIFDCNELHKLHRKMDLLHFHPSANLASTLDNLINNRVSVSTMTFGQDQRHRTIHRSNPTVNGDYYIPPLVLLTRDLVNDITDHFDWYFKLVKKHGSSTMIHFIPYGAMVQYNRIATPAAWFHCQKKRKCNNAQLEISQLEDQLSAQLSGCGITNLPEEPCADDICPEGKRYCGRSLNKREARQMI